MKRRRPVEPLPSGRETHLVIADAYDRAAFARAVAGSGELRAVLAAGELLLPRFRALVEDMHAAIFRWAVETVAEEATPPSAVVQRRLLLDLLSRDELLGLREATVLDEARAAAAVTRLASEVQRELARGELLDEQELIALRELEWTEEELRARRQALADSAELGDAVARGRAALEREADQLEGELRRQAARAAHMVEGLSPSAFSSLRGAAADIPARLEEAETAAARWGDALGVSAGLPAAERLALGARLAASEKLRELARLVGSFRYAARAARRRRVPRAAEEVHDVVFGRDLGRLVAAELTLLAHPSLRRDLLRRLHEGAALTHALRGEDERGRGPVVVLLDGSGSMAGPKELWAKAVALTLLDRARRSRRGFRAVVFSGPQDEPALFAPLLSRRSREPQLDPQEVMRFAEHFPGGGTDFARALDAGVDLLGGAGATRRGAHANLRGGDLVLITDGECRVEPAFAARFLAAKREIDFRLYAVLVNQGSHDLEGVAAIADRVTTVTRLTARSVRDLFLDI